MEVSDGKIYISFSIKRHGFRVPDVENKEMY